MSLSSTGANALAPRLAKGAMHHHRPGLPEVFACKQNSGLRREAASDTDFGGYSNTSEESL